MNERAHPSINPLNKLVRCGLCGRLMRINFVGKGKKYVYIQKCPATVNNEKCNNSGVNVKYVMPLIYETIRNRIPIIEQKLDEIHKGTFNDRIKK